MGSLVAATLLLFSAIACSERLESKYATGAEALKVDAGHGWLPVFLPKDATRIQELHDLDSNDFWGTFDGSTITSPMTFCKDATKLSGVSIQDPGVNWWPKSLTGEVYSSNAWALYRCAGSNATLIAPAAGHARYFWVGKG